MFSKIGPENTFLIKMFKLKVAAINLVYIVCGSNKSALGQTEAFIKDVEEVTKDMSEAEIAAEPFLVGVLTSLAIPEAKPGYIARKLKPLLVSHPLAAQQTSIGAGQPLTAQANFRTASCASRCGRFPPHHLRSSVVRCILH